ncbi:unnamed protein product [Clonostachys rhizophaga]|uniref:Uncharacterized protein n=1 Tax=Clonostachys rhizophaga TaxID=160324 RepID=A0A9N9YN68_9HYPO|nr:unnamed protein product [Clonostachys rhizophaga]
MVAPCQTTQPKGRSHLTKRKHPDEPSPQDDSPSIGCKRQRTDKPSLQGSCSGSEPSWQYPPIFWDRLSSIPLIPSAVEELQRRIYTPPPFPSRPTAQNLSQIATRELARFARHGGPDLRDLRGYPQPIRRHRPADTMNSPPQHQGANATDPSTMPTPVTTPTKPTTNAYHAGFEQHLIDHEVHPPTFASQGPEWAEIMEALDRRRPSLSPSLFSSTNFDTFRARNFAAKNEAAVLRAVIPTITGPIEADPLCLPNAQFTKLKPLTDGTIVPAKPDFYYGADPKDLDRSIRDELAGDIIPSAWEDRPMVPNFFLEVKGPKGTSGVATLQACYDGALGSRAMHRFSGLVESYWNY